MKTLKALAFGLLALAAAPSLSAQSNIVITGSSAYRPAVHRAIYNLLAANGAVKCAFVGTGTDILGSNATSFTGTYNGGAVRIKTSWSGSAAGIQTVAQTSPSNGLVGVFTDATADSGTTVTMTGSGNSSLLIGGLNNQTDPRSLGTAPATARPDIALADNTQDSTLFTGTYLGKTYAALTPGYTTGSFTYVGIVPFKFIASATAGAGFNATPQFVRALFALGFAPKSLATGLTADQGILAVAAGRDPDSGTRITTLAETGYGIQQPVVQYKPSVSAGSITTIAKYAATTINGVPVALGNSGESSGGTLAGFFGNTGPTATALNNALGTAVSSPGFLVSYVSNGDAATAIGLGGKELTYNGVTSSNTAIFEGQYTFWAYEQLYVRSTAGIVGSFANALGGNIDSTTASIFSVSMNVSRQTDGGVVGSNLY
jgi:hypothetical protein